MMKTTSMFAFLLTTLCSSGHGQTLDWTRQLGTNWTDDSRSVSADGLGNVYISGSTEGNLDEGTFAGSTEAFLVKYDASGAHMWTQQLGTGRSDISTGVSADGLGNVYISGNTNGILGASSAGGFDAFLSKYDASGPHKWTQQLGTSGSDSSSGVSADGLGNVYISGHADGTLPGPSAGEGSAFLSKYDASGVLQWTQRLGAESKNNGVSADGLGNVYVTGETIGTLQGETNAGRSDAFIAKYDSNGMLDWARQLGTSLEDASLGISADGLGSVYISGTTRDSLGGPNVGSNDGFVAKYDANGMHHWTQQFGTDAADVSQGVSADGLGNVYISGFTSGSLGGLNVGENFTHDAFIAKYDASGAHQWTRQIGTSSSDESFGVSADGLDVYIVGRTGGSLVVGPGAGLGGDAFVAKYTLDFPRGDFDRDRDVDGDDADALVSEIVAGTNNTDFDLTADEAVNNADLGQWLVDAANANGFAEPLLPGDANLDGSVDAADLNNVALSWRHDVALWTAGDFTADGTVDPVDLNWLAINWRKSIPSGASQMASAPEPGAATLAIYVIAASLGFVDMGRLCKRSSVRHWDTDLYSLPSPVTNAKNVAVNHLVRTPADDTHLSMD